MRAPRVNPVGLVEHPAGYSSAARSYSLALRLGAAGAVGVFLGVSVATTVYSLGVYCLTSHASLRLFFTP